ncbi:MAG TPA: sugar phosphate isomerase/epimerase family protein [Parafilimonas sp.]|nr:sugar phosphate isomerase/epimerase family protein [Parafilimonas sp.]
MLNRRTLLKHAALLAALSPLRSVAATNNKRFNIGACDWSLGKRADIAAFDIAKQIGLDGIMVDLGSADKNLPLRDAAVQQAYLQASKQTGIKISSIAIGELNNVPYKSDERTIQWVSDSIDVAKNFGVTVVLLAFFNKNDLRNDAQGKQVVIERLKEVSPKAEKNGIILGIESYLDAAEHLEIIDQVGSPNIKVYFDFRNTADAGYDVIKEVKQLGADMICELHMKENGFLLGEGTLNWQRIRDALYEMNYAGDGWMQIEWAMPKDARVVEAYKHNLQFLQNIFN